MNTALPVFFGLLLGLLICGAIYFGYLFVSTVRKLSGHVERLASVLGPILESGELLKMFQAVRMLGMQGETIGKQMAALTASLTAFSQIVVDQKQPAPPATGESGVYRYNEEAAAINEAAAQARAHGIETQETYAADSSSLVLPPRDVF